MISLEEEIVQILTNDPEVTAIYGDRIERPNQCDFAEFPVITYKEVSNVDANAGDNVARGGRIVMQVDVWHKDTQISAGSAAVAKALKANRYKRFYSNSTESVELGYERKTMRFRKSVRDNS